MYIQIYLRTFFFDFRECILFSSFQKEHTIQGTLFLYSKVGVSSRLVTFSNKYHWGGHTGNWFAAIARELFLANMVNESTQLSGSS